MTKAFRAVIALAVVSVAALLIAAPASAAKLGGSTLAPTKSTFEALSDIGVTVTPTGKGKETANGLHFPVTGGKVDPETGTAKFVHTGGLQFAMGSSTVDVENFVVKVAGKKNLIKADSGDGKLRFADLNAKKLDIQEKGSKFVYSNIKVFLAKKSAKALASAFNLNKDDLAGLKLGKLTTKFKG